MSVDSHTSMMLGVGLTLSGIELATIPARDAVVGLMRTMARR